MQGTKCLGLLIELSDEELIDFEVYLKVRYRPKKLMVQVFKYFRQNQLLRNSKKQVFEMSVVYRKLCKKKLTPNGKKTFQNALSDLYQDVVDFLLFAEVSKDSFERDWLLLQVFQRRHQKKMANNVVQARLEKLRAIPNKEQRHYLQIMQLNEISHFNNYQEKVGIDTDPLVAGMDSLDSFYTISKLQYSCEMKNRAQILVEAYDIPMLAETLHNLEGKNNQQPLEKLYAACYRLIESNAEGDARKMKEKFDSLLKQLEENGSLLSKRDQLVAYGYLENHLVQQIRKGEAHARKQLFALHEKGLAQEVYIYQGYMIAGQFNNIIHNACKLKAFEVAKTILKEYQIYLPPTSRSDWYNLLNGTIYFEEKDFAKSWAELASVQFLNDQLALRAKALLIRCFYELGESEYFITRFCNAFYTFIKKGNRQLSSKTLGHYLMLIKYIKILVRKYRTVGKVELAEQIKAEKYKLFAPWLLEKVDLLDN
ncbi:MAG: hypothetical protein AAGJ18_08695 [Bacteroidota bacterium]